MKYLSKLAIVIPQIQRDVAKRLDKEGNDTTEPYVYRNAPVRTGQLRDSGESSVEQRGDKITYTFGSTSGYGRRVPRYLAVLGQGLSIMAGKFR